MPRVVKLDHSAWKAFQGYAREVLVSWKQHNGPSKELTWDRQFLGSCDLGERFHCEYFGLEVDGQLVSMNASYFGTKKRCGWGRYLNVHYAYTLFGFRKLGYASQLFRFVEEDAFDRGLDRLKSLAGSYGGFRLHLTAGHDFWGRDSGGHIQIDAPLARWRGGVRAEGEGVPRHARGVCARLDDKPTDATLLSWLTDPDGLYRASPEEAAAALARHRGGGAAPASAYA